MSESTKKVDTVFDLANRLYLEKLFVLNETVWKAPASNSVPSWQCFSTHSQDCNFTRLKLNQDCKEGVKGFPSETLVKLSLQSWPCVLEHCHDGTEFDAGAFQTWMEQKKLFDLPSYLLEYCMNSAGLSFPCKHYLWILDSIQFIDGCKVFQDNEEEKYSQFFEHLLSNPALVADCLKKGHDININSTSDVALTLVLCCYGNDFITDNGYSFLKFMEEFFILEINNKKKLDDFDDKESIFHFVFRIFTDTLLQGKSFLASTLKPAIKQVVKNKRILLETNQNKLITTLNPDHMKEMFGVPESPKFQKSVQEHIHHSKKIILKLCSHILSSFLSSVPSLPPLLGQIFARMSDVLKTIRGFSDAEACGICADIFLTHFICPAIANPELYGLIDDVNVSEQCRLNLMQVSQMLRAFLRTPDDDVEYHDLVSKSEVSGFDYDLLFDIMLNLPEEPPSSLLQFCKSDSSPGHDEVVLVIPLFRPDHWPGILSEAEFLKTNDTASSVQSLPERDEGSQSTTDDDEIGSAHDNDSASHDMRNAADGKAFYIKTIQTRFANIVKTNSSTASTSDNRSAVPDSSTEWRRNSSMRSSAIAQRSSRRKLRSSTVKLRKKSERSDSEVKSSDIKATDGNQDYPSAPDAHAQDVPYDSADDSEDGQEGEYTKAHKILGVEVFDGVSMEKRKSILKAEKMLGVTISHEQEKHGRKKRERKKGIKKRTWKALRGSTVINSTLDFVVQENGSTNNRSTFSHKIMSNGVRLHPDRVSSDDETVRKLVDKRLLIESPHKSCNDLRHYRRKATSPVGRRFTRITSFCGPAIHSPLSPTAFSFDSIGSLASPADQSTAEHSSQYNVDLKDYLKTKLRTVFSTFSIPHRSVLFQSTSSFRSQLLSFLRFHLARCHVTDDARNQILLRETARCIESMNDDECRAATQSLHLEYDRRSSYVAYLVHTKQHLHSSLEHLQNTIDLLDCEKNTLKTFHILQEVRGFLNQQETSISSFENQLQLLAPDEKVSEVADFLNKLHEQWNESLKRKENSRTDEAKDMIERIFFSRLYNDVMFPYGQVDVDVDQVWQRISRISDYVTPQHDKLLISDKYLVSYPWLAAQDELRLLPSLSSPMEKLKAIVRCCRAVITLLELADPLHPPAADDLLPVLVFVIIKTNPPHLHSTQAYIENYIAKRLEGIESYFWVTFNSALFFINNSKWD